MYCMYVYNVTQPIKRITLPHAFFQEEEIILPDKLGDKFVRYEIRKK